MKKIIAIILALVMVFSLAACGKKAAGPEQQIVGLEMGLPEKVQITVTRNPGDMTFSYSYEAYGNSVTASGTYTADGTYEVTNDPSGMGALALNDIVAALDDAAWTPVE